MVQHRSFWAVALVTLLAAGCAADESSPALDTTSAQDTVLPSNEIGLYINEIAAKGDPDDWFELYNAGETAIDLSGLQFSDDIAAGPKATFEQGLIIEPKGFLQIICSDETVGFKLGKDEELGLYDADGALIDSVDWNDGDAPEGASYGRSEDGGAKWTTLTPASPGSSNQ